jgi:hypothetical protein
MKPGCVTQFPVVHSDLPDPDFFRLVHGLMDDAERFLGHRIIRGEFRTYDRKIYSLRSMIVKPGKAMGWVNKVRVKSITSASKKVQNSHKF